MGSNVRARDRRCFSTVRGAEEASADRQRAQPARAVARDAQRSVDFGPEGGERARQRLPSGRACFRQGQRGSSRSSGGSDIEVNRPRRLLRERGRGGGESERDDQYCRSFTTSSELLAHHRLDSRDVAAHLAKQVWAGQLSASALHAQVELLSKQLNQFGLELVDAHLSQFAGIHHMITLETKAVRTGSLAAPRRRASRAPSSLTPSIS